ncbi:MAG: hypothetical protein HOO06_09360 [Bdellovibrionaceae bacterium]|nr:hypothetical protein [Pseudobdellovibrionaceae bacterium]
MDKISWIKDLIDAEVKMEESGMVDFSAGFNANEAIKVETVEFIKDLKVLFVEASSAFNQMKTTSSGQIKIYGIAKTIADFMLFRNGYKLIFSIKGPGKLSVSFNHIGNAFIPGQTIEKNAPRQIKEDQLVAEWVAFEELIWKFKDHEIKNLDFLVRYYMTRFVRESV